MIHYVGAEVDLYGPFSDPQSPSPSPIDPTAPTVTITKPDRVTVLSYVYGVDPATRIWRARAGLYVCRITVDEPGTWTQTWSSAGPVGQSVGEATFFVLAA